MPASFAHANGSITFSLAPTRGEKTLSFQQAAESSAGGEPYAYPLYVKDDIFTLPLRLTTVERGQFVAFWATVARGMANPFTYTDVFSTAIMARFASPRLPAIVEHAYNVHLVTVQLRVA